MTKWIQVVGVFDAETYVGEILGVQPVREPKATVQGDSPTRLIAMDEGGTTLTDVPVVPEYGSCGDGALIGSFQVFLDLPDNTRAIVLMHEGNQIEQFVPDVPTALAGGEGFDLAAGAGHSVDLASTGDAAPGGNYILQARAKGSNIWETLDIGIESPDTATVDLRQFPDAERVEVRVLKSTGFETVEIDRHDIEFPEE
ncbi:MAG: hypothetical protein ABJP33_01455 [Pseudoruegeria sp.]